MQFQSDWFGFDEELDISKRHEHITLLRCFIVTFQTPSKVCDFRIPVGISRGQKTPTEQSEDKADPYSHINKQIDEKYRVYVSTVYRTITRMM